MLTSALTEALQRFLDSRRTYMPLTQFVGELRRRHEQMLEHLPKLPEDSGKWTTVASEIQQVMAQAGTAMRGNPSSVIFKATDHLDEAISQVPLVAPVEKLRASLDLFKSKLDAFIEGQDAKSGFYLLQAADGLGSRFDALVELAESVAQALEPEPIDDAGHLVIAVEDDLSLEEMAAFLTTFARVYRRLAEIAQLDDHQRELRARKVESGSWWMDLAGNPTIMTLLGGLVTAFFGWSYRRYTQEGRAKSLPEKLESVQKVLNLREKLKEAGYSVENLDSTIQHLEKDVARELIELFEPHRRVRVDNAVYTRIEPVLPELGVEVTKLISGPPKRLFLPGNGEGAK